MKTFLMMSALLMVLCASPLSARAADENDTALPTAAQAAYDRGNAAAEQRDWDKAIQCFSEAQKLSPESPKVLFNLGLAHIKAGHAKEGLDWLRAYLAVAPTGVKADAVRKEIARLEGLDVGGSVGKRLETFTWPNGDKYVGECNKDDKQDGQGTYTWADGSKYVGEWRDGKSNGQGTLTWPDGSKYVGEWKEGKRNGQGTITRPDGSKRVGEWKDDKENGSETYTWPDRPTLAERSQKHLFVFFAISYMAASLVTIALTAPVCRIRVARGKRASLASALAASVVIPVIYFVCLCFYFDGKHAFTLSYWSERGCFTAFLWIWGLGAVACFLPALLVVLYYKKKDGTVAYPSSGAIAAPPRRSPGIDGDKYVGERKDDKL